jgi:hypothetical protein
MKFEVTEYNKGIGVESQDLEVQFAFAVKGKDDTYTNICDFSICRDFLGDVVVANVTGKSCSIYGFSYNPKKQKKMDMAHTYLALRSTPEVLQSFKENLNRFRSWLGNMIGHHNYFNIIEVDTSDVIVVQCNPWWQTTTVGISYLSYLFKCLCWKLPEDKAKLFDAILALESKETPCKEARYIRNLTKEAQYLLQNLEKLSYAHTTPHGYPELEQHISKVHNNSGFNFTIQWKRDTLAGKFMAEMV